MSSWQGKPILVLGCGNILFGDDGFGPKVVEELEKNYKLPTDVYVVDAGTGVRKLLFDIALSEERPKKIIIVDAVDKGKEPGEVFELSVDEIPLNKIDDFSMHQLPTSNLLKELKELGNIDIRIISSQVEHIPSEVSPGLSRTLTSAIPVACERIVRLCMNGE